MRKEYPFLSERFDVDDIRTLRDYDSLRYMHMTPEEVRADIKKGSAQMLKAVEYLGGLDKIYYDDEEVQKEYSFLSDRFDADDIQKLRDYDSLRYMHMTREEIRADIKKGAAQTLKAVEYLRGMDKIFFADDTTTTSESAAAPEPALEEQAV